jgi:hypothetical protein
MADSRARPAARPAFGQLDFDLGEASWDDDRPPSTPRRHGDPHARPTASAIPAQNEATRVVQGDPLSNISRAAGAPPAPGGGKRDDNKTRAGNLEEELMAVARGDVDEPPPSSASRNAPSESHIAPRDQRVAAMRELYANGDAEGALRLASAISTHPPRPMTTSGDSPDASIVVEFGDEEEISDPYGGLIPVDRDSASEQEEADPEVSEDRPLPSFPMPAASSAADLSLTERQGIPRVVKSPGEIAKLPIDNRAGFLLMQMDGMQTMEEILDVCAMPAGEALDLIEKLRELGVIVIE